MDKNILTLFLMGGSLLVTCGVLVVLFVRICKYKKALAVMAANYHQQTSDHTLAEEKRQKLEKVFMQGQKLQAIGTLAGGIAHDFNNILYAITGYTEMAKEDTDPGTSAHSNLGKVLDAAKRGQELVARILAFSRRQHHNLYPLNLQDSLEGALDLLRSTIPASVSIHTEFPSDSCIVKGNQTQLHQVMVNLVTNAVDAMEGEGNILVCLEKLPADNPLMIHIPHPSGKRYCKLTLSDTGHGIDPSHLERIFEPFFTTKEVGRGTGLGLSTVHSIVKEHKGEIIVDSQPGNGTTFTLLLPLHNGHGEQGHGENPAG